MWAKTAKQPFTLGKSVYIKKEQDIVVRVDGVTYSMLTHAGLVREAAILAVLNYSAGEMLPSATKLADIQPIPKPRNPIKLR